MSDNPENLTPAELADKKFKEGLEDLKITPQHPDPSSWEAIMEAINRKNPRPRPFVPYNRWF